MGKTLLDGGNTLILCFENFNCLLLAFFWVHQKLQLWLNILTTKWYIFVQNKVALIIKSSKDSKNGAKCNHRPLHHSFLSNPFKKLWHTGWPDWISWLWSISGSQIYLTNVWKMISFLKHLTGGSSSIFCQLMQISRTSCHEIQRLIQHSCFSLDGASKCYVIILSILQLIHQIIHYWNFF